ncbi:hypothetical protein J3R82DRAFT_4711 [Butyriboletus roseoflavus]|nr:hypothetical protein J3R82DRAFT_4711 [Butyriboletus roseoflavus]
MPAWPRYRQRRANDHHLRTRLTPPRLAPRRIRSRHRSNLPLNYLRALNGDSIVQPFKRSMDETRDTAASFRYFTILEADVARARQQHPASLPNSRSEGSSELVKESGISNAPIITTPAQEAEEVHEHPPENLDRGVMSPTDGTPRRRKVKFDIQAGIPTGEGASSAADGEYREDEGEGLASSFAAGN